MCRNIRPLFNFEPPASDDEIRAAALQFVRKISGFTAPSRANEAAFDRAVDEVASAARRLMAGLVTSAQPRDREIEAEKARERSRARFAVRPLRVSASGADRSAAGLVRCWGPCSGRLHTESPARTGPSREAAGRGRPARGAPQSAATERCARRGTRRGWRRHDGVARSRRGDHHRRAVRDVSRRDVRARRHTWSAATPWPQPIEHRSGGSVDAAARSSRQHQQQECRRPPARSRASRAGSAARGRRDARSPS